MMAWFKDYPGGHKWRDSLNKFGAEVHGEVHRGVFGNMHYAYGSPETRITWGNILNNGPFTIFTLSKYTGKHRGRIFSGGDGNWVHGHWGGKSGVARYQSWVTQHNTNPIQTGWLVMCGQNVKPHIVMINGGKKIQTKESTKSTIGVYTNAGSVDKEKSDYAVAEVMTWNYGLSEHEMKRTIKYLESRLKKWKDPKKLPKPNVKLWDNSLFKDDLTGWNFVGKSRCGKFGTVLGGYNRLGSARTLKKTYGMPCKKAKVSIKFSFVRIDSWDNEWAWAKVNDKLMWQKMGSYANGAQVCGEAFKDEMWKVEIKNVRLLEDRLTLEVGTTLNTAANEESWGIRDIEVSPYCKGLKTKAVDPNKKGVLPPPKADKLPQLEVSNIPGLIYWFRDFPDGNTKEWKDVARDYKAKITGKSTVQRIKGARTHYLKGGTDTSIEWGNILRYPGAFTICTLSKYDGGKKTRIFNGDTGNWAHAHWGGFSGVAHYGTKWVTNTRNHVDGWTAMCGQNAEPFTCMVNGNKNVTVARVSGEAASTPKIFTNGGSVWKEEKSDYAIAEVMTYNRGLSEKELKQIIQYLEAQVNAKLPGFEITKVKRNGWTRSRKSMLRRLVVRTVLESRERRNSSFTSKEPKTQPSNGATSSRMRSIQSAPCQSMTATTSNESSTVEVAVIGFTVTTKETPELLSTKKENL